MMDKFFKEFSIFHRGKFNLALVVNFFIYNKNVVE